MPVPTVRLVVPYLKHYWPLNPVAASHRSAVAISEVYPMSKLQLARAYAPQGNATNARAPYQHFFAYRKDADPDIPILKQAKAEYAKLQ
jgi:eukaryotic-like serine/threonine-protein kinase